MTDHKIDPRQAALEASRRLQRIRANTRVRDRIDIDVDQGEGKRGPTPQQVKHADYVHAEVNDLRADGSIQKLGSAWQRRARFERIDDLSDEQLRALRFYRATFDQSERSLTKSALDIRPRGAGGSDATISRLEKIVGGWHLLHLIEAGIPGHQLQILHAVALQDMDFKQVAIVRYGGRTVERVDTSGRKPAIVATIEPRSGRHRALVRDQFMAAAASLVAAVKPYATTEQAKHVPANSQGPAGQTEAHAPIAPAPAPPPIDPRFLDERGILRPFHEIKEIILGLRKAA